MWITVEDVQGNCSIITTTDTAGGFEVLILCSICYLSLLHYMVSNVKNLCSSIESLHSVI